MSNQKQFSKFDNNNEKHKNVRLKNEITNSLRSEENYVGIDNVQSSILKNQEMSSVYNTSESKNGNTILITNNLKQNGQTNTKLNHKSNKSSITIVTSRNTEQVNNFSNQNSSVVLDRINICINNHYPDTISTSMSNNNQQIRTNQLDNENFSDEPDSTTNSNTTKEVSNLFNNGQDVLVQHKDGRLYLGTIIAVARNQCLVKFGDSTESWSSFNELTKLSSCETEAPVCVVCKQVTDADPVEVCEKCGRGYHEKCTEKKWNFGKNGVWFCKRCTAQNRFRNKESRVLQNDIRKMCSGSFNKFDKPLYNEKQLPYTIDSLTWDLNHRVNEEQIYCYCGGNGEWYTQMLQCVRCEQWFHEKCIQCLQFPLYCGDRFYVFVCSMCNYGNEFIRRLELKWEDVVHLLLFNLTIFNQQKYYDLTTVILPYAEDNWEALQLPPNLKNKSRNRIREIICDTLLSNNNRFKSGKEIRKRGDIWGLRSRIPPGFKHFKLAKGPVVTDELLNEKLPSNLKILASSYAPELPHVQLLPNDETMRNIMMGIAYQNDNSDNDSMTSSESKFISDDETPVNLGEISTTVTSNQNSNSSNTFFHDSDRSHNDDETKDYMDVDDIDDETKIDFVNKCKFKNAKSLKLKNLHINLHQTLSHNEHMAPSDKLNTIEICDSSDDTSSRGTLDLIIPPPKDFQGKNNPFHNQNLLKTNVNNVNIKKGKRKQKEPLNRINIEQQQYQQQQQQSALNAAGQFRLVRTVKRHLSAKDLLIGPNQEVKRRKIRRRSGHVEIISTSTIPTASKTAAYLPIRTDLKDWSTSQLQTTSSSSSSSSTPAATTPTNNINSNNNNNSNTITTKFTGRRLRQRQEKNYSENSRRSTGSTNNQSNNNSPGVSFSLPGSPSKTNGTHISMTELQSSVNIYFGATNRIANGEKFVIRGKRLSQNGRIQYLIEWEGM